MNRYNRNRFFAFGILVAVFTVTIAALLPDNRDYRLPKALESFQIEPSLDIGHVAAEPLVIDPTAIAFDEDRQMYVVEDRDTFLCLLRGSASIPGCVNRDQ